MLSLTRSPCKRKRVGKDTQNMCGNMHECIRMCPLSTFGFLCSNLRLWCLSVDDHYVYSHILSFLMTLYSIRSTHYNLLNHELLMDICLMLVICLMLYVMMSCYVHCSIYQCVMICADKHVHMCTCEYGGQKATPAIVSQVPAT